MNFNCTLIKCLFIFLASHFTISQSYSQPYTHTGRFDFIDSNINGFWEYLPWHYASEPAKRYPLLIFIHGAGESGDKQNKGTLDKVLRHGTPKVIDKGIFPDSFLVAGKWYKFIVISPQIISGIDDNTRSSTIAPSTIQNVIDYAKAHYRIDSSKIYLSGLSMGGGATWSFAGSSLSAAKQLAGIIIAAGAYDLSQAEAQNIAQANLPVIATHNRDDNTVYVYRTENNFNRILSTGIVMSPAPRAVIWETGGHAVWGKTFEQFQPNGANLRDTLGINAYEWALQFQRNVTVPVVWRDFNLQINSKQIVLNWSVTNEVNVRSYAVERKTSNDNFEVIATLPANGTNNDLVRYKFIDAAPAGVLHYRIRQTDIDGKFSYSIIRSVNFVTATNKIHIYPNPFVDKVMIESVGLAEAGVLELNDAAGKLIKKIKVQLASGSTITFDKLGDLNQGIYYLLIKNKSGRTLQQQSLLKK
ncbi:MAG TPA: T9SS type A sorting domain-containing protein [Flavitalea sp.]|nr:T9SS type A sorting domain-containing protein [Flavitalea sp.]